MCMYIDHMHKNGVCTGDKTTCMYVHIRTVHRQVCMRIGVRPCMQVLHDNQDGQPSLPPRGVHQGHHHQLHRHLIRTGGPAPQVRLSAHLGLAQGGGTCHWLYGAHMVLA